MKKVSKMQFQKIAIEKSVELIKETCETLGNEEPRNFNEEAIEWLSEILAGFASCLIKDISQEIFVSFDSEEECKETQEEKRSDRIC